MPVPGGDFNYPSPMASILPGFGGGDIHLNQQGYQTLARYCIVEFYGEWLDYPKVFSVTRVDSNPTGLAQVRFTVTFSELVDNVDVGDFDPAMGGALSGANIDTVTEGADASVYVVVVNTGSGQGTLGLKVLDNDSIVGSGGAELGGPGVNNGFYAYGLPYNVIVGYTGVPVAVCSGVLALLSAGIVTVRRKGA